MDAQITLRATAALVALVQCLVALELDDGLADERAAAPEVLVENRFLAARDGVNAALIDVVREARVPVRQIAAELVERACPTRASWPARPSCGRCSTSPRSPAPCTSSTSRAARTGCPGSSPCSRRSSPVRRLSGRGAPTGPARKVAAWLASSRVGFHSSPPPEAEAEQLAEQFAERHDLARTMGAFEGSSVVATFRSFATS